MNLNKRFLLLLALLPILQFVSPGNAIAQSITNYTFSTSTTGSLDAMTGATSLAGSGGITTGYNDDKASTVLNIGFNFSFMGSVYTQFSVNSNGQLRLGGTVIGGGAITSFNSGVAVLAPMAGDNSSGFAGDADPVSYLVTGSAPNRILKVQWKNLLIPYDGAVNTAGTMQAWLYEANGQIDFVYGAMYNSATSSTSRSIFISSSNTATTAGYVTVAASPSFTAASSPTSNSFAASSNIANLYSAANGSRRVFSWTPNGFATAPSGGNISVTTATSMSLSWADNASNETGYAIFRSTDNTTFTYFATAAANATSYTATGLLPNQTYYWRIFAIKEAIDQANYTSASGSTPAASFTGGATPGVVTVGPSGADYTTITAAVAAINAAALVNNVDIQLLSGYTSAGETFPLTFPTSTTLNTYQLRLYPTVTGLSITSSNTTGTISLDGSAKVVIDGRINATGSTKSLVVANTSTSGFAIRFINDASNDTVRYCSVQGVNTSTTSGTIVFSTGVTTGNDNNLVDNCDILDGASTPANGIYSSGTSATIDNSNNTVSNCNIANYHHASGTNSCGISIASNNSGWTISDNRFYQTATRTATSGATHRAILITSSTGGGYNVSNNVIGYANASGTGTTTYTGSSSRFEGIDVTVASTPVSNIQGNTISNISVTSSSGGSAAIPVFGGIIVQGGAVNVGTTAGNTIGAATGNGAIAVTVSTTASSAATGIYVSSSNSVTVQNNNIGSLTVTGSTASTGVTVVGVNIGSSTGVMTVSSNNIGSASTANSITLGTNGTTTGTCIFTGILNAASGTPVNLNSNNIYNIRIYSTGTSSAFTGIQSSGSTGASGVVNMNSNVIRDINAQALTTGYGLYESSSSSSTTTVSISNNQFYNFSCTGTGGATTIYGIRTSTSAFTVNNNQINNLSITANSSTSSSTIYGIHNSSSPVNETVNNNNINTLSIAGASTSTSHLMAGIYFNTAAGTRTVSYDTIHTFTFTNSSTGTATIHGMFLASSSPNIFKNRIYNLSAGGTLSVVYGLTLSSVAASGTANIYNNLIGDLRVPAGSNGTTDLIRGINMSAASTGATFNVSYNTIFLNASSTGTNFTTSGLYHTYSATGTNGSLVLRNNNIVNLSTPAGTGLTIGIRRNSAADLNNYSATSNNNNIYAGTPGSTRLVYYDGTNSDQTLAAFKSRMGGSREISSVTENPTFLSTTGASADFLHIDPATASQLESGGTAVSGITDDYDGDTRQGNTGYTGSGTGTDIGADEFAGTALDVTGPVISYTSLTNSCNTGSRTLTATVTDANGVPTSGSGLPVLYWAINGGTYNSTTATSIGSNQYQFSLGSGTASGDNITYYIAAQDNLGNVSVSPSTGSAGTSANPPAVSTPPTTPSSYQNIQSLAAGTYTIPGNYATLTAAIADYNSKCVSGNVIFELANGYTSAGETFPLTINANPGASSSNTLLIRPASGQSLTISGAAANDALIKLNGADFVTIDGSNSGGTSQNLTITNTSTTSPVGIAIISAGTGAGAINDTIRNCIISTGASTTSYGIHVGGTTAGSNGADNDNVTLQNNSITVAAFPIFASGTAATSTGGLDNLVIRNNNINTSNAANSIGIQAGNAVNSTLSGNTVSVTTSATSGAAVGIYLSSGFVSSTVNGNLITQVNMPSATGGYGSRGIVAGTNSATSNLTISNNVIYGVNGSSNYSAFVNSSSMGIGIGVLGNTTSSFATVTGGVNLYNNSVFLSGTHSYGAATLTAALYVASTATSLDVRNNIFANSLNNTNSSGSGSKDYAVYMAGSTSPFTTIDYNLYYGNPTNTNSSFVIGYFNSSDRTTLSAWQTATGQDTRSFNQNPNFTSTTNLLPVTNAFPSNYLLGVAISGITTDVTGSTRSSTPDIGAYEGSDQNRWIGVTSTAWTTGSNWDDGNVPATNANITVSANAANNPTLAAATSVNNLHLYASTAASANLDLNGQTLTIGGALTGTGTLKGSSTSSLVINGTGALGTLRFDQTTDGTTNALSNFTLNRTTTGSATLGNKLVILNTVTLSDGTLNTGGFLTLRSNASGTARIAQITGTGTVSGDVTVERYIPSKLLRKYIFLASPVTATVASSWQQQIHITGAGTGGSACTNTSASSQPGTNSNGFDVTASNAPSFFTYDHTNPSYWTSITSTTQNLAPGVGYRVNVRGDRNDATNGGCAMLNSTNPAAPGAVTLSATGAVTTGNKNVTITNAYELVGNPYPCEIDFTAFQSDATNSSSITSNFWLYNPQRAAGVNTYTACNNGTATNTSTLPGGYNNVNIIASGQAFFVEKNAGGTVTFKESHKVTSGQTGLFKTTTWKEIIRVGLERVNDSVSLDDIVIRFDAVGSLAYDNTYDAHSLNSGTHITSLKGGEHLAIQTRPVVTSTDTVGMFLNSAAAASYNLHFTEHQGMNANVYLVDHYTNTVQDVKANPYYSFSTDGNSLSQGASRFELVFMNNTVPNSVGNIPATLNATVYPNPVGNEINIVVPDKNGQSFQVSIIDAQGKKLMVQQVTAKSNLLQLNASGLSSGVYFVIVSGDHNYRATARFIK